MDIILVIAWFTYYSQPAIKSTISTVMVANLHTYSASKHVASVRKKH